jgi:hypothetical protein
MRVKSSKENNLKAVEGLRGALFHAFTHARMNGDT